MTKVCKGFSCGSMTNWSRFGLGLVVVVVVVVVVAKQCTRVWRHGERHV